MNKTQFENKVALSEVKYRHFIVEGGPLLDEIHRINTKNDLFNEALRTSFPGIDINSVRFDGNNQVMAVFFGDRTPEDMSDWREVNNDGWFPKKNTTRGKKLAHEFASLPEYTDQAIALNVLDIGFSAGSWMSHKGRGYRVQLGYHHPVENNMAFIVIPWLDIPPSLIDAYSELRSSGEIPFYPSIEMMLGFKQHPSMREVDKWEYHKVFDGLKAIDYSY